MRPVRRVPGEPRRQRLRPEVEVERAPLRPGRVVAGELHQPAHQHQLEEDEPRDHQAARVRPIVRGPQPGDEHDRDQRLEEQRVPLVAEERIADGDQREVTDPTRPPPTAAARTRRGAPSAASSRWPRSAWSIPSRRHEPHQGGDQPVATDADPLLARRWPRPRGADRTPGRSRCEPSSPSTWVQAEKKAASADQPDAAHEPGARQPVGRRRGVTPEEEAREARGDHPVPRDPPVARAGHAGEERRSIVQREDRRMPAEREGAEDRLGAGGDRRRPARPAAPPR